MFKCQRCALRHPPLVRHGLRTAAIVGTVLVLINQGDVLLRGAITWSVAVKMILTYTVPFVVSLNGALAASRVPTPEGGTPEAGRERDEERSATPPGSALE